MSGRHGREAYYIAGEGMRCLGTNGEPKQWTPSSLEESVEFRFSRFVPGLVGAPNSDDLLAQLAVAMLQKKAHLDTKMPAGYTYLGQFVDHDMTLDPSELDLATTGVLPLQSLRSPTLDLDSLYGRGPDVSPEFYQDDGVKLLVGRPLPIPGVNPTAATDGYDLPRRGNAADGRRRTPREAKIPDIRNDENLAVAQVHAAFIRFHNKVVDDLVKQSVPSRVLFERARETVTKHYHWMLRHDYLPRICKPAVVDDVYGYGRRVFETNPYSSYSTMPVEFSGAAFRLGHSMIRASYEWNKIFNGKPGAIDSGHLFRLFRFSGTSGTLAPTQHPPGSEEDLRDMEAATNTLPTLPSNWVADLLRLFDFSRFKSENPAFVPPKEDFNFALKIDSGMTDPLSMLPIGSFGATDAPLLKKRNLAFRNLMRGRMLGLASGQQMVQAFKNAGINLDPLNKDHLFDGSNGGVKLTAADVPDRNEIVKNTPLWFYVLREAEFNGNKLGDVGARIVAETFHRAMQTSHHSIVTDPSFKPTLGPGAKSGRFNMEDLLHYAFDGRVDLLNPHQ
jgi:Animal haem peroxidase